MSWLFSRALVEAFLVEKCSAGEQSAQLSVMPTQHKFWHNGKTMDALSLSQFGLTCAVLTEDRGTALLMSYLGAFPAKTSATAATKLGLKENEAGYGSKWHGSFAKFDLDSCSWKTSQRCLVEGWASFSQTWPRWGLMRDGECWELQTLEASKSGNGFGYWPTLKASDGEQFSSNLNYFKRRLNIAPDLPVIVALSTPPTAKGYYGRLHPEWCEWLMGWPIGWTKLDVPATGKTLESLPQPGELCREVVNA
jgi:hypothetical protein